MKSLLYCSVLVYLFGAHVAQTFAEGSDPRLTGPQSGDPLLTKPASSDPPSVSLGSTQLKNPLDSSISSIPDFFRAIIDILLVFAIPFVVFFIVWAGFLYVTARGNAEKIKQAHSALLYALIGGLLILGANLLLDIISNTVKDVAG